MAVSPQGITDKTELDQEWIALIQQAKQIGLTTEEVRTYLQGCLSLPEYRRILSN
ncbi:anti-repressor SinI family protein [Oceanobacillus saliphilus]|uniref:anti-repressor SinI family protein n=1 Tax=Oceanobacillus saliphilus TaxID=2925834 RepID=UPI00201D7CC2|nr:anti-repressor SinI family protein [Oceanobacillus saliphilus]